jgi:ABC-2 type transport system ATP-binding protein
MVAMRETLRYFTADLGKTVVISSHLLHEVELLADMVGIIDHGRLISEGLLAKLLDDAGRVKVRVAKEDMARAYDVLKALATDRPVYGVDEGEQAGWFTVHVAPHRASEVNRVLADAGIYASGLEPGSDLESVFLALTGSTGTVSAPPPAPSGPVS